MSVFKFRREEGLNGTMNVPFEYVEVRDHDRPTAFKEAHLTDAQMTNTFMVRSRSLKVKLKAVVAKVDNPAMLTVGMSEAPSAGDWRPVVEEVVNGVESSWLDIRPQLKEHGPLYG